MKKQILSLVMLMGSLIATEAHAYECTDQGFYVGGFAGVDVMGKKPSHVSADAGFAGGASVGYKFDNHMRVEGEFAYRRNKLSHHISRNTYSGMGNVYYDFDNSTDWTPYVGAGVGYARTGASARIGSTKVSASKGGLAYQGMGGVSYRIADKTHVGVEYRYFRGNKNIADHTAALTLKRYF